MKFILSSMLLTLMATSAFAGTSCHGLADGYEDISIDDKAITLLGSEENLVYNILSENGSILIARNAKIKSDLVLERGEKSATMFIGTLTSYQASECKAKGKTLECQNRKKSLKISGKSIVVKSGTTSKKYEVLSNNATVATGADFDTASHYSVNGVIALKTDVRTKVLDGRKFEYENCEKN